LAPQLGRDCNWVAQPSDVQEGLVAGHRLHRARALHQDAVHLRRVLPL
jgi:hypothetical protein